MDRQFRNALILPRNAKRLRLDLLAYLIEVCESFVGMQELAPFGFNRVGWRLGCVDELEHKRSTCDDALPTRKKVSADYILSGIGISESTVQELLKPTSNTLLFPEL